MVPNLRAATLDSCDEESQAIGHYRINEIFYSLHGEGVRTGTANVFIRFSGCNLACSRETHGFDCDTEFISGTRMSSAAIVQMTKELAPHCAWVVLTGGEPLLQVDYALCSALKSAGYQIAVETNGTVEPHHEVLQVLDWIVCSPKVADHAIRLSRCEELKYVRAHGQGIPRPQKFRDCPNKLISPAFDGPRFDAEAVSWCVELVKANPDWRLTLQTHKLLLIR